MIGGVGWAFANENLACTSQKKTLNLIRPSVELPHLSSVVDFLLSRSRSSMGALSVFRCITKETSQNVSDTCKTGLP